MQPPPPQIIQLRNFITKLEGPALLQDNPPLRIFHLRDQFL
jgi:hypothetical protein